MKALFPTEDYYEYFIDLSPNTDSYIITLVSGNRPFPTSWGSHNSFYIIPKDLSYVIPIVVEGYELLNCSWSPDSLKLAVYGMNQRGGVNLFVFDRDGSNLKTVSPSDLAWSSMSMPFWYADSSFLYWTTDYQLRVTSTNDMQNRLVSLKLDKPSFIIDAIKFSSDGSKVAYSIYYFEGFHFLYLAKGDFSEPRMVYKYSDDVLWIHDIVWSPDMSYVLFNFLEAENGDRHYDEWSQLLVNETDGQISSIPWPEGTKFCGWSPDMRIIAYYEKTKLYLAEASDPNSRQLVATSNIVVYMNTCPIWVTNP